jgi:1,4-dihydroxy-2-naphthoate octaprenyltransferase
MKTAWLRELRLPFAATSGVLVLLGSAAARNIDIFYFFLTLASIILLHLGANVVNDYFDFLGGTDNINKELTPFSGGSRVIQQGLLKPDEVYIGGLLFLASGSVIGVYLVLLRGLPVLILGLIGVFCAYFYVHPKINIAGSGLGEFSVGLSFGLIVPGAYYVQVQKFDAVSILAGIIMGILVASVLWVNEFPDYAADEESGKKTLVVRLGRERATVVYAGFIVSAYVLTIFSALVGFFPKLALVTLVTLPMAYKASFIVYSHHSDVQKLTPASAATIVITLIYGTILTLTFVMG